MVYKQLTSIRHYHCNHCHHPLIYSPCNMEVWNSHAGPMSFIDFYLELLSRVTSASYVISSPCRQVKQNI